MKPDYLYHYTSIESLAMILSTKKIRFNSLVHVDDLVEGKCKTLGILEITFSLAVGLIWKRRVYLFGICIRQL